MAFGLSSSHDAHFQHELGMKCDTCKKKVKSPSKLEWSEGSCQKCIDRYNRFIQKEDTLWDRIVDFWLND